MVRYGQDLGEQNPWWKSDAYEEQDRELSFLRRYGLSLSPISRLQFEKLEPSSGKIFLLKGPRRVGKTTYMKQVITELIKKKIVADSHEILYLNIEGLKLNTPSHLRKTIRLYFDKNREQKLRYIFLDEVTVCQGWEEVLQGEYDVGSLRNCVTFVTGSDPKLLEEGGNKLSGRGISGNEFLVRPLTFRDFIILTLTGAHYYQTTLASYGITQEIGKNIITSLSPSFSLNDPKEKIRDILFGRLLDYEKEIGVLFDIYLKTGGFPEAIHSYYASLEQIRVAKLMGEEVKRPGIEDRIYEDILRAILEKLNLVGKESSTAEKILYAISDLESATGTSTYSGIAKKEREETALHPQTVEEYVKSLNKWMIIDKLENYIGDGYLKKMYISDPFILHSIRSKESGKKPFDYSLELLEDERKIGMLVECIVGSTIRASEEIPIRKETETFLSFYRKDNEEIDFVFKTETVGNIGIEVKYQEEPSLREIKKLENVDMTIVLTKNETDPKDDIWFIPVPIFLALIRKSDKHL